MRRPSAVVGGVAAAVAAAVMGGGAYGQTAQINFTVPADMPQGGVGIISIRQYSSNNADGANGCCENSGTSRPEAAIRLINDSGIQSEVVTQNRPYINFNEAGCCNGVFGETGFYDGEARVPIPEQPRVGSQADNYAVLARGIINVPAADTYTFGINSDDSFVLAFPAAGGGFHAWTQAVGSNNTRLVPYNGVANGAMIISEGRGADNSLGTINLPAGPQPFILIMEDGNGGDNMEFYAARGNHLASENDVGANGAFNLVGGPRVQGRKEVRETRNRFAGTVQAPGWQVVTFPTSGDYGQGRIDSAHTSYEAFKGGNTAGLRPNGGPANFPLLHLEDPENAYPNEGEVPQPNRKLDLRAPFPGNDGSDENDFGAGASAVVNIPANRAGRYTFSVLADDNSRMRIFNTDPLGNRTTLVPIVPGSTNRGEADSNGDGTNDSINYTGCCDDSLGQYDLSGGNYIFEVIMSESGGGASLSLYGAFGAYTEFNNEAFQIVGENINEQVSVVTVPAIVAREPGLVLVPEPGTAGLLGVVGLGMLARRRRRPSC